MKNKLKFITFIILVSLILTTNGCTTTSKSLVNLKVTSISFPELENTLKVTKDTVIIQRTVGILNKQLKIIKPFDWNGAEFYPAQSVSYKYYDKEYEYYGPLEGPYKNVFLGLSKTKEYTVLHWGGSNWQLKLTPEYDLIEDWDYNYSYVIQNLTVVDIVGETLILKYRQTERQTNIKPKAAIIELDLATGQAFKFLGCEIRFSKTLNKAIVFSIKSHFTECM
jgi:hypothetical protein